MLPKLWSNYFFNNDKIFLAACCEVVQADNFLIQLQKVFDQMRSDKTSTSRHQPGYWPLIQLALNRLVFWVFQGLASKKESVRWP